MSVLLAPFRALGLITDSTPFALLKRGKQHFVTTSIGRSFHIYDCARLRLQFVSPLHPDYIRSIVAYKALTFTACGTKLYVWHRARLVSFRRVDARARR
jgi:U3 small nucleolar RNA-associated protein 21